MNFPVFDLHCDTACALIDFGGQKRFELYKNDLHIDLHRAKELPGYAQCFACFTTTSDKQNPVDLFEKTLSFIHHQLEKNAELIRLTYSPEEIEENLDSGLMSAILTIEGPAGFGFDPALLEDLSKIGFRMSTLGWNEKNPLTGSHVTGGGLTGMGAEYVRELQRLGMLVDVSHISDEGFWDIIEMTEGPVVASHSNSRSVFDCSRNLTDDMFRAICQSGGVAGINLYADFLSVEPTIDTVCDHIIRFLELDPRCNHIALGGDLDGCERFPAGFSGIQDYDKIALRLQERGLSDEFIHKIFWDNALGVMKNALHNHKK